MQEADNITCPNTTQPPSSPDRYTPVQELLNNIPYIAMVVLGTTLLVVSIQAAAVRVFAAIFYLLYGVVGALWIMLFVCPYCRYHGTRSCPCGYGRIAARFRPKQSPEEFPRKFKRHIPVIVPLWFIPPLVALAAFFGSYSTLRLVLLLVFVLEAFVLLPLVSTKHGCRSCPQKDICPWMKNKTTASPSP